MCRPAGAGQHMHEAPDERGLVGYNGRACCACQKRRPSPRAAPLYSVLTLSGQHCSICAPQHHNDAGPAEVAHMLGKD